jgi:hypothetical protein
MRIGQDEIRKAEQTRKTYEDGKAQLNRRIIENQEWFRMQHWREMRLDRVRRHTAWLLNAIANKHADFMDNMPEVNVLPREKSDEKTARSLTEIMPVVLDRAHWKAVYSEVCYDKLKFGAGVYGVLWDPNADDGMGNVAVEAVDVLSLSWEPGIKKLQDSANIFFTEMIDHEELKATYQDNRDVQERLGGPSEQVAKFIQNENIDTSEKSLVVNWYYKRSRNGRTILHYCRYTGDILLYASEDDERYADGWYGDGRYPFVMDSFFPDKDSPHGMGLIDIGRDTQEDIDQANDLFMRNMKAAARRRYFINQSAGVNEKEFADYDNDLVHVNSLANEQAIKEMSHTPFSGTYVNMYMNKVQELKEITFNRDVNAGGSTTGGVTSGVAISALQEAGSKSSRDNIQQTYEAVREVCEMVIERIRQFYTVPHIYRVMGEDNQTEYREVSNEGLQGKPIGDGFGMEFGTKKPVFDLSVKVSKQNVWSRSAQNQDMLNFYAQGFFAPQNATAALACLEVLEIDNKDRLIEVIKRNGMQQQFMQQFLPMLLQAAQANPQLYQAAMQAAAAAGLVDPAQMQPAGGGQAGPMQASATDANGRIVQKNRYMDKQRAIANDRTTPGNG